jgi:hypothetical protein
MLVTPPASQPSSCSSSIPQSSFQPGLLHNTTSPRLCSLRLRPQERAPPPSPSQLPLYRSGVDPPGISGSCVLVRRNPTIPAILFCSFPFSGDRIHRNLVALGRSAPSRWGKRGDRTWRPLRRNWVSGTKSTTPSSKISLLASFQFSLLRLYTRVV